MPIEVVGAVIVDGGRILAARRGPKGALAGKWEFPGGKIEPGETAREALTREIEEELHCDVRVHDEIVRTEHAYDFGTIALTTFYCDLVSGVPLLEDHSETRWCSPAELSHLDWAPADVPAVHSVVASLSGNGETSACPKN